MARFPTTEARQELGVTPATAVRFRGDTRTGEGLAGAAVGQAVVAGISTIQRIRQKRQDMLDTRSSITAGSFMTTAINENIAFRNTNADTMTWAKDLQERLSRAESQIGTLNMSDDTRLLINAKFQAKSQEALSRSLIAETDRDKIDTRDAITIDVVEQYTNGTPQDQQDAGKRFLEIASTLMDENEARATLKTAIMAGQKARIENQKKDLMNRAAVNPKLIASFIDTELKVRKKGKTAFGELASMSNTDLEDIRDYANSVGEKVISDSKIAADAAVRASYKNIINGGTDIAEMASLILIDPTMTDDDKTRAVDAIRTFFTTWNSAIEKEGEDIVTSNATRIKALRIIKAIKTGKLTDDEGIEVYKTLSKVEEINGTDSKQFINDIFAAGEAARSVEKKRQNDVLAGREKQLRDAIEKQQNILDPDIATEILKDFANIAVIELNDAFREGDFTKEEVDIEVNRLLNRFTLSEAQQQMAVNARSLRLAKNLKEQQESITKIVTLLREQGKEDEAKRVMDDAIRLGIFIDEGGTIKKGKKKTSVGRELIKRILDSIIE